MNTIQLYTSSKCSQLQSLYVDVAEKICRLDHTGRGSKVRVKTDYRARFVNFDITIVYFYLCKRNYRILFAVSLWHSISHTLWPPCHCCWQCTPHRCSQRSILEESVDMMETCISCRVPQSNVDGCAETMKRQHCTSECCQDVWHFALHTCAVEKLHLLLYLNSCKDMKTSHRCFA